MQTATGVNEPLLSKKNLLWHLLIFSGLLANQEALN
jgi:hypothetical protein